MDALLTARRTSRRGYAEPMRRLGRRVLCLYVLFAVIGRFVEAMGAVCCECADTCWCHRPVLSTFRWVFPFGHTGGADPH